MIVWLLQDVRLQFRQENLLNEFGFLWRASQEHPAVERDLSFVHEMTARFSNGQINFENTGVADASVISLPPH